MAQPSKDTTPAGNRSQRYRIDGRAYLNGTMVLPSDNPKNPRYEYGPPGQSGKALVAVDEAGAPIPVPARAKAVAGDSDVTRLRRQLDAAFAEIEKLKGAIQAAAPVSAVVPAELDQVLAPVVDVKPVAADAARGGGKK